MSDAIEALTSEDRAWLRSYGWVDTRPQVPYKRNDRWWVDCRECGQALPVPFVRVRRPHRAPEDMDFHPAAAVRAHVPVCDAEALTARTDGRTNR
jgi:hypothetical protein